ncbi:TPA: hypothetical protein QH074_004321 [Enterobacter hormaechei subsp. steigerwaltii]|nr:hypothetical protein [Enterobacter hormaechei subsp. steigerwaltii]
MKTFTPLTRFHLTPEQRQRLDSALAAARRLHGVTQDNLIPRDIYRLIVDTNYEAFFKERDAAERASRPAVKEYESASFTWSPGGHKHRWPPGFEK